MLLALFQVKKEDSFTKETVTNEPAKPSLDLAFKEGQTIRVNLNIDRKKDKPSRPGGTGLGASPLLLPPPPGASSAPALRPAPASVISPVSAAAPLSNIDLLGGLESAPVSSIGIGASPLTPVDNNDPWGDFTSAPSTQTMKSGSWEQF